jgi:hypothetical protein
LLWANTVIVFEGKAPQLLLTQLKLRLIEGEGAIAAVDSPEAAAVDRRRRGGHQELLTHLKLLLLMGGGEGATKSC